MVLQYTTGMCCWIKKMKNVQIAKFNLMCTCVCIFKQYQNLYTVKHENECKPANTISILYLLF